jgi:DNA polymerase elongation subunit (family B)
LRDLVRSRREVKEYQKKAKGVRWEQLNIQQLALKLTANRYFPVSIFLLGFYYRIVG